MKCAAIKALEASLAPITVSGPPDVVSACQDLHEIVSEAASAALSTPCPLAEVVKAAAALVEVVRGREAYPGPRYHARQTGLHLDALEAALAEARAKGVMK
jgi:hypothetical protein